MSSVCTMGFPAGVIRQPLGKSDPPGMECGSCVVDGPMARLFSCCPERTPDLAAAVPDFLEVAGRPEVLSDAGDCERTVALKQVANRTHAKADRWCRFRMSFI